MDLRFYFGERSRAAIFKPQLKRAGSRPVRRGFSFTEILFAVMILGIGFIMIAAIFPVAIQQTQATGEETTGASIARGSVNYLQNVALLPTNSAIATFQPMLATFPKNWQPVLGTTVNITSIYDTVVPGAVWSFHDPRQSLPNYYGDVTKEQVWARVRQSVILPSDRRYAWVPMYRRDKILQIVSPAPNQFQITGVSDAAFAQVILIGVQVRNRSTYDPNLDLGNPNTPRVAANLEPMLVTGVRLNVATGTNASTVVLPRNAAVQAKAAEGAYIVVSDDHRYPRGTPMVNALNPSLNGHVYRLGNRVNPADSSVWELAPGNDLRQADFPGGAQSLQNVDVLMVGRGFTNPQNPALGYDGNAQDIGVYTTFIQVSP